MVLPVYAHVADRSSNGQGSIAMLERLVRGWNGKIMVVALLGFAATDFVITKTLSAADAAVHMIQNPLWKQYAPASWQAAGEDPQRMALTIMLLIMLGLVFMRGFKEVIGLAAVIVAVYLALNVLVIGSGLVYLSKHPDRLYGWYHNLTTGNWYLHEAPPGHGWLTIIALSLLYFPKLALGLSGFETGVAVMPLIEGDPHDDPHHPLGRIRNTRKLLATAAIIMSVCLLGSSLVTATLIEPQALQTEDEERHIEGGPAADRALAYL